MSADDMGKSSETNWERVDGLTDEMTDTTDIPPLPRPLPDAERGAKSLLIHNILPLPVSGGGPGGRSATRRPEDRTFIRTPENSRYGSTTSITPLLATLV